jgi:hypothetical protein
MLLFSPCIRSGNDKQEGGLVLDVGAIFHYGTAKTQSSKTTLLYRV